MMCICPDGNYANYGEPCGQSGPSCPVGTELCGSVCCNPGFFCSVRFGCIPEGASTCGSGYCDPGMKCTRSRSCIPDDALDCGNFHCSSDQRCGRNRCLDAGATECDGYACKSGYKCSSGGGCIPSDAVDCGNQAHCKSGTKCSRDGKRCLALDAVDCGSYSCKSGAKCASGSKCAPKDWVDCGSGVLCTPGQICGEDNRCTTRQAQEEKKRREAERLAEEQRQKDLARAREQTAAIGSFVTQSGQAYQSRLSQAASSTQSSIGSQSGLSWEARQLQAIADGVDPATIPRFNPARASTGAPAQPIALNPNIYTEQRRLAVPSPPVPVATGGNPIAQTQQTTATKPDLGPFAPGYQPTTTQPSYYERARDSVAGWWSSISRPVTPPTSLGPPPKITPIPEAPSTFGEKAETCRDIGRFENITSGNRGRCTKVCRQCTSTGCNNVFRDCLGENMGMKVIP